MAVLEKIRVKLGIFITILVALALLSFIIDPNTLSSTLQMVSSDNEVGEMNGKAISYKDFYTELENNKRIIEATQGSVNSEEAQAQLRNMTWQSFFNKNVFEPAAKDAGLIVGSEEMYDLTQGANISPVLLQERTFSPNGDFSREALSEFVQNMQSDASGLSQSYWNYLEENVKYQQLYAKYLALLQNTEVLNKVQLANAVTENNIVSDVDFVVIPLGYSVDSTITVSGSEIKAYYNARRNNMKRPATRDIEYVMFEVVPSEQDKIDVREEFDALCEEFAQAENLKNFISLNSDTKWNDMYLSARELESIPEFAALASAGGTGLSEVHVSGDAYSVARISAKKNMPDEVTILYTGVPSVDQNGVDSVYNAVRRGSRENLNEFIVDQKGAMESNLPELLAVMDAKVGDVVNIKLSNLPMNIIAYVQSATPAVPKYQMAILTKNINPSDETYRDFLMKATDIADRADGKYEKFAQITKEENLPVIPVNNMMEITRRIGICDNAREVVRWAFDSKKGAVSDVITVDNKYYFVAAVTNAKKEGYQNVEEVADQIRMILSMEKKSEKIAAETKEKIEGCTTMEEVAERLNTTVSHQQAISFGSTSARSLDPKFVGAIAKAQQGAISGPVAGDIGVYVFQVVDKQSGTFFSEEDARTAAMQNTRVHMQAISGVMSEEADVKDNRARFF